MQHKDFPTFIEKYVTYEDFEIFRIFVRFLKEHDACRNYLINLQNKDISWFGLEIFKRHRAPNWINSAFNYRLSSEGIIFWQRLSYQWQEESEKYHTYGNYYCH